MIFYPNFLCSITKNCPLIEPIENRKYIVSLMGQCNYRWCSSPEKLVCEAVCYTKKIFKKEINHKFTPNLDNLKPHREWKTSFYHLLKDQSQGTAVLDE